MHIGVACVLRKKERGAMKMNFALKHMDGISVVSFSGNLHNNRTHEIREVLMLAFENAQNIILNLTKTKKISYHCLKAIYVSYRLANHLKKQFIIQGLNPRLLKDDPDYLISNDMLKLMKAV